MLKSTQDNERRSVPAGSGASRDTQPSGASQSTPSATQPNAPTAPISSTQTTPAEQTAPTIAQPIPRIVSLTLRGEARQQAVAAARAGQLRQVARADVLAEERLPALARESLWLLFGSAMILSSLITLSRYLRYAPTLLGDGPGWLRVILFLLANIVAYVVMIPLHEAVHALTILAQGGRPRFGLRMPIAAYCTAPNQLFTRNGYIVVALAPLVALTILGLALIWFTPDLAACLLLGFAGNISGAVGDLAVVRDMRRLAPDTLIADDESGYTAYSYHSL